LRAPNDEKTAGLVGKAIRKVFENAKELNLQSKENQ